MGERHVLRRARKPEDETKTPAEDTATADWRRQPVENRPGVLIRRVQQIHTALFAEETGPQRITPIMYSVLTALRQGGPMDQTRLAQTVAIDKTNLADVLERLRERGLVTRRVPPTDRRVRLATLTAAGRALLDTMDAPVSRAHARTIEALEPDEQALFVAFLQRIVTASEGQPEQDPVAAETP